MTTENRKQNVVGVSGVNIALGVWLILAPFILGFSGMGSALWNSIIFGVVIAGLAALRVSRPIGQAWASWVNVAVGIWVLLAPFILGFSGTAAPLWNSLIVGALVAILGWRSASAA